MPPALNSVLSRIDALYAELDALRPLSPEQAGRAMQRLRLEWTYHSNAIEGNSLTYGETAALLMHGVTAQGKPLKDHLDIRGHREALDYLEHLVRAEEPLTLASVREMHRVLLGEPYKMWAETPDGQRVRRQITPGAFKTMPNHVQTATGEAHYYASPEDVEPKMQAWIERFRANGLEARTEGVHPILLAAALHHEFTAIHPFDDGNGRMGRLLMNLVLLRAGLPPVVVRQERRPAYYGALAAADAGDLEPLSVFVAEEAEATLSLYLRALRGEPDPDVFSRRIALLKRQAETASQKVAQSESSAHLGQALIIPALEAVSQGVQSLTPSLFLKLRSSYHVTDKQGISIEDEAAVLKSLSSGDWLGFFARWDLEGLIVDPRRGAVLSVSGQASNEHITLTSSAVTGPTGNRRSHWSYTPDTPPAPGESDRIAQHALNQLADVVEKALAEPGRSREGGL